MKKILFLVFILISFQSFGGDWELFPLGQRSYFSYPDDTMTKVEVYAMDSVVSNGSVDSLYFRKKPPFHRSSTCNLDSIRLNQWDDIPEFLNDSLIKNSDTTFYYSSQSTLPFYFITSAVVGQSWIITSDFPGNDYNQITITCDSVIFETFIGLSDSVKVFSMTANGVSSGQIPVNSFKIKLSKNYGLIEFVPLIRFLVHPFYKNFFTMKLIGIESDSIQAYYRQPAFSDYFDLSPGDILFWDYYVHFIMIPFPNGYHFNYRDSITNVAIYPDSVIYTYDRMVEDTDNVIISYFNKRMYFVRSMLEPLVEAAPDWYEYGNIININSSSVPYSWNQYWTSDAVTINIDSINNDTITSIALHTYGARLDTISCNYSETFDYYDAITVNSRLGLTSIVIRGPETLTLTGSRINGVQNGNITLDINEKAYTPELSIFPNPSKHFINIGANGTILSAEYSIFSIDGINIRKGNYTDGEISISDLVPGIYFVKLISKNGNFVGRFVKE